MFVRSVSEITRDVYSEPARIAYTSDVANLMKNIMHSFLSKEGVFTDLPEGLNALALTSNGYKVLNVLLGFTHPLMTHAFTMIIIVFNNGKNRIKPTPSEKNLTQVIPDRFKIQAKIQWTGATILKLVARVLKP